MEGLRDWEGVCTAFVAGVEAECKLGVSVFPEHYSIGWRTFPSYYPHWMDVSDV